MVRTSRSWEGEKSRYFLSLGSAAPARGCWPGGGERESVNGGIWKEEGWKLRRREKEREEGRRWV